MLRYHQKGDRLCWIKAITNDDIAAKLGRKNIYKGFPRSASLEECAYSAAVLDFASSLPIMARRLSDIAHAEYEAKVAQRVAFYSSFDPDAVLKDYPEEFLEPIPKRLQALKDKNLAKFNGIDPRIRTGADADELGLKVLDRALKPIVKKDRPMIERLWVDLEYSDPAEMTKH